MDVLAIANLLFTDIISRDELPACEIVVISCYPPNGGQAINQPRKDNFTMLIKALIAYMDQRSRATALHYSQDLKCTLPMCPGMKSFNN